MLIGIILLDVVDLVDLEDEEEVVVEVEVVEGRVLVDEGRWVELVVTGVGELDELVVDGSLGVGTGVEDEKTELEVRGGVLLLF